MKEAGLDLKDPQIVNRFPPLGSIKWHRAVLDVRPAHHVIIPGAMHVLVCARLVIEQQLLHEVH